MKVESFKSGTYKANNEWKRMVSRHPHTQADIRSASVGSVGRINKVKLAAGRVSDTSANKDEKGISSSPEDIWSEIEEVQVLFGKFEPSSGNATFYYWRTCTKFIPILSRFTQALREGDRDLCLA